jgi:hypothetical protein
MSGGDPGVGRPAEGQMSGRASMRMRGVKFVAAGLVTMAGTWLSARWTGMLPLSLSFIAPFAVSFGLWLAIEGPENPREDISPLGWAFIVTGSSAGVALLLPGDGEHPLPRVGPRRTGRGRRDTCAIRGR